VRPSTSTAALCRHTKPNTLSNHIPNALPDSALRIWSALPGHSRSDKQFCTMPCSSSTRSHARAHSISNTLSDTSADNGANTVANAHPYSMANTYPNLVPITQPHS